MREADVRSKRTETGWGLSGESAYYFEQYPAALIEAIDRHAFVVAVDTLGELAW